MSTPKAPRAVPFKDWLYTRLRDPKEIGEALRVHLERESGETASEHWGYLRMFLRDIALANEIEVGDLFVEDEQEVEG
jgi:hypothetical protein